MHKTVSKWSARKLAYVGISTALIVVCTWIAVPLPSGIAFTMQTFAVCVAASLLGWKYGTLAVVAYLLLGAVGLPVFSGFRAGAGVLLGATGGYLIGFLFMAPCTGLLASQFGNSPASLVLSMISGEILLYLFGTVWFVNVYAAKSGPMGYGSAFAVCVLPYLLPDAAKIALAAVVVRRLRPYVTVGQGGI